MGQMNNVLDSLCGITMWLLKNKLFTSRTLSPPTFDMLSLSLRKHLSSDLVERRGKVPR